MKFIKIKAQYFNNKQAEEARKQADLLGVDFNEDNLEFVQSYVRYALRYATSIQDAIDINGNTQPDKSRLTFANNDTVVIKQSPEELIETLNEFEQSDYSVLELDNEL